MRILVIEDEDALREDLRQQLTAPAATSISPIYGRPDSPSAFVAGADSSFERKRQLNVSDASRARF